MSRMPRTVGRIAIVVGIVAFLAGFVVYGVVRYQLSEQKITVSDDAPFLAGRDVKGPFTALAQASAINKHAIDAGNGKTYAELAKDDPARNTVMTADFLQASLYTSVVAFGVAVLISLLGVMVVLLGLSLLELDRRTAGAVTAGDADARAPAPTQT